MGEQQSTGVDFKSIQVFVSSPGDCAEERKRAAAVMARVSKSSAARRAKLVLTPVVWEELPGGVGEKGDTQHVIRERLAAFGLADYEIYLGFMKSRLGTPTPHAASGTIEEFEDAYARHLERRLPSEVLFYFIGKSLGEVATFRASLEKRNFLFSSVDDAATFEASLETHLQNLIANWSKFERGLKRARRWVRPLTISGAALSIALLLTYYITFDRGGLRAVEAAAARDAQSGLNAWGKQQGYLLVHRAQAERAVRASLLSDIAAMNRRGGALPALALAKQALDAELLDPSADDAAEALHGIAAQRLFDSLAPNVNAQEGWEAQGLTAFEHNVLVAHARRVVNAPGFMALGTPEQRLAFASLADDPKTLRSLADVALERSETRADPPEIRAFVLQAPVSEVKAWLTTKVRPHMLGYRYEDIHSAVRERAEPELAVELLDLFLSGRTPFDFLDNTTTELFGVPHSNPRLRRAVSERLQRWDGRTALDEQTMSILAPYVEVQNLAAERRAELAAKLLAWLSQNQSFAVEELLARLDSDRGRAYLRERLDAYLNDKIAYGEGERIVLMRQMELISNAPTRDRVRLAEVSAAASRKSALVGPTLSFEDVGVQAQFLSSTAASAATHWPLHRKHVTYLVRWRVGSLAPAVNQSPWVFAPPPRRDYARFDEAFAQFVARLLPSQLVELFALPRAEHRLAEFDGSMDRWLYLLGRLEAGKASAPAEIVRWGLRQTYFTEKIQLQWDSLLATLGGDTARALLRNALAASSSSLWRLLALNGDVESMAWLSDNLDARALPALLEAMEPLPAHRRAELLVRLLERHRGREAALLALLTPAEAVGLRHEALSAFAAEKVRTGDRNATIRALSYLGNDPETLRRVLNDSEAMAHMRDLQRSADAFDWIVLAQFALPAGQVSLEGLMAMLSDRPVMTARDDRAGTEPRFRVSGKRVEVPLLADVVSRAGVDGLELLTSLYERRQQVVGGESLPQRAAAYGGYCLWLGVDGLLQLKPEARPTERLSALLELLRSGTPEELRGAAAWLAAWSTR